MHLTTIQGVDVPSLGYGTFQLSGRECERGVAHALSVGYRHIDTARAYENEDRVGAAMARVGVARDEVFLTTKLWLSDLAHDRVGPAVDDSLRPLRTDHVDLGSLAFELTDDERRRIDGLERGERLIDPSFAPAWEE